MQRLVELDSMKTRMLESQNALQVIYQVRERERGQKCLQWCLCTVCESLYASMFLLVLGSRQLDHSLG